MATTVSTTATWYRGSSTSPWQNQIGYDGGALVGRFQFKTPATGASSVSFNTSSISPKEGMGWNGTESQFRFEITSGASDYIGKVSSTAGAAIEVKWNPTFMRGTRTPVQLLPNTTYYLWLFPSSNAYKHWGFDSITVSCDGVYGTPSTVSCTNPATFGTAATITLSRNQTSALHTVTVNCLGKTENLMVQSSTYPTLTWTPSIATYAPLCTDKKSASATITVETFYNNYSVGKKSVTITVNFPNSIAPTASMTVSDPTGLATTYGAFVATKSAIKVQLDAVYQYGSEYGSAQITANGAIYTTNPATTEAITSAENTSVTGKIVDSRGFASNECTQAITIFPYSPPLASAFSVHRCNQDGTANDSGAYVRVDYSVEFSPLGNQNSKVLVVNSKRRSDSVYTETAVTLTDYSETGYAVIEADTNATYDVQLVLTDDFSSVTVTTQLSTAFATVNFRAGGRGIAIGKVSEQQYVVEIAQGWDLKVNGVSFNALFGDYANLSDSYNQVVGSMISVNKTQIITALGKDWKFRKVGVTVFLDAPDDATSGSNGTNTIGTLDEDMRPSIGVRMRCANNNNVFLLINPDGEVQAYNSGSAFSSATNFAFSLSFLAL